MRKITLNIASGNSQGLQNDVSILKDALKTIELNELKMRNFSGADSKLFNFLQLFLMLVERYIFNRKQITVHLEEIYQEISHFSDVNILIPNQEWLRSGTRKAIKPSTLIWCKTQYAVKQLQHLNNNVEYLGFCSRDLLDADITPDFNSFIHIAGKSEQKGTIPILNVWQKHPEWPTLTVVSRRKEHTEFKAENIKVITDFLSENALKTIINESGIHLCPSEAEGFGHNIVEAMSTNSIVVTTNAPPMNDLIATDERCLVNYNRTDKRYFSELFFIDEDDLERVILSLISLPNNERISIANKNRTRFLDTKSQYEKKLGDLLKTCLN